LYIVYIIVNASKFSLIHIIVKIVGAAIICTICIIVQSGLSNSKSGKEV
jgi:hypothetical protein